ncbi:MAG: DUF1302 family protein [Candidatus Binatia bacterium]
MERMRMTSIFIPKALLILLMTGPAEADSILDRGWWENFFKERIEYGGFVENSVGLSIASGDSKSTTSNRFIMNRFTIQPELSIDFAESLKLFVSWRFVKEPRYNKEAKDRRRNAPSRPPLKNTFYDEDSFKPWEMVWDIIPTDRLSLRVGKQLISWGETTGLRILDVINPQDGTFAPLGPNLFSLDETRIPMWGLRVFYTVRPVSNTILEFIVMPGFDERDKRVDEGAPIAARWRFHPETRIGLGCLFVTPTGPTCDIIPSIHREFPDAGDNWKIGARITHNIGKLSFGLGYIWGFNPQASDLVFKLTGSSGSIASLKLFNDRTSIFAAHFNYPLGTYGGIPIKTAVSGEFALYPSKPYNISKYPGSFGLKAGPHPRHPKGITEKNTLRYSLSFDRSTFIPFLHPDDPWRAFLLSLQVFQSIIFDHEDGIRSSSSAEKIKKVSTSLTFGVRTGYFGDTILPGIFLFYDPRGYWGANPAVSYLPPWNEKIKLTLTAVIFGGRNKFSSFGLFSEKDSIFLKMRYQF